MSNFEMNQTKKTLTDAVPFNSNLSKKVDTKDNLILSKNELSKMSLDATTCE